METRAKIRRVIKSGEGLIITLPADFVKLAGIQRGDAVGVTYNERSLIIAVPSKIDREREDNADAKLETY